MKFQKSVLKIYESLLLNIEKKMIIEDIINKAAVGRTSGFKAVEHLIKTGIATERKNGRQREVILRLDRASLGFKLFLDSFKFKESESIKFAINLFIESIKEIKEINAVLLFGSSAQDKNYNDIDIFLICKQDNMEKDRKKIFALRNKVELISGRVINIHFSEYVSIERFVNSICIYGFDFCVNSILKDKPKDSFLEAFAWLDSYKENKNSFENLLVNLAFAYCYSEDLLPKTKEEAKSLLLKKYSNLSKNNIKGAVKQIGEKIFR